MFRLSKNGTQTVRVLKKGGRCVEFVAEDVEDGAGKKVGDRSWQ